MSCVLSGSIEAIAVSTFLPIALKRFKRLQGETDFAEQRIAPNTFVAVAVRLSSRAVVNNVPWCGVPMVINLCTGLGSRAGLPALTAEPDGLRKYRVTSPPILWANTSTVRAASPDIAAAASASVMFDNKVCWIDRFVKSLKLSVP